METILQHSKCRVDRRLNDLLAGVDDRAKLYLKKTLSVARFGTCTQLISRAAWSLSSNDAEYSARVLRTAATAGQGPHESHVRIYARNRRGPLASVKILQRMLTGVVQKTSDRDTLESHGGFGEREASANEAFVETQHASCFVHCHSLVVLRTVMRFHEHMTTLLDAGGRARWLDSVCQVNAVPRKESHRCCAWSLIGVGFLIAC